MGQKIYTKEDCIEALKEAEERLGKSPTTREYRSLDISPSTGMIRREFGSFNEAKKHIGMELCSRSTLFENQDGPPDVLDYNRDEWESLSKRKRRGLRLQAMTAEMKLESGCTRCGFDEEPIALDFHHIDKSNKEASVSALVNQGMAVDRIEREVEKCEVLCANCHRIVEQAERL